MSVPHGVTGGPGATGGFRVTYPGWWLMWLQVGAPLGLEDLGVPCAGLALGLGSREDSEEQRPGLGHICRALLG